MEQMQKNLKQMEKQIKQVELDVKEISKNAYEEDRFPAVMKISLHKNRNTCTIHVESNCVEWGFERCTEFCAVVGFYRAAKFLLSLLSINVSLCTDSVQL
jgi:hypothetical protein